MAKVLYIDACSGLSGDMLAGALLELGWPLDNLRELIEKLGLGPLHLREVYVEHQGLAARRIIVEEKYDEGYQCHSLSNILKLLANLPKEISVPAARIFTRLAEAEAKVHGRHIEEGNLHEVGAIDAIIDVVAFCAGLVWLGINRLICSPLPLGRGFIICAHGRLPLPAPAVLTLLSKVPIYEWPVAEETVTPTGAAIVSTLAEFSSMPIMRLIAIGIGGGKRISQYAPNIVRLLLGEDAELTTGTQVDEVCELTCHIDNMNPEDLPIVFERFIEAGALDVAAIPLIMKKSRPGLMIIVLSFHNLVEKMASLILSQTTSLGLRLHTVVRRILPREIINIDSPWGQVRIKKAQIGKTWRFSPESEDVALLCRKTGLAPHEMRMTLEQLAQTKR